MKNAKLRKEISTLVIITFVISTFSQMILYLPSSETANAQSNIERFDVRISATSYAPGEAIILYGRVLLDDTLVVRLFDSSGKVVKLETILARNETFTAQIFVWPQPSKQFPFGAYTLEARSSLVPSDTKTFPIYFVDISTLNSLSQVGTSSPLAVKLDSPASVSTGVAFRIFVQVTHEGALVNANSEEEMLSLLGSSHIHFGDSTTATIINLSGRFDKLHEGLYYADVILDQDGSYVIHAIAFNRGLLSHDSKVVVASGASIGTVQESVNRLNDRLDETNRSLDQTNASLDATKNALTEFADDARITIGQMRDASGQINGLILPILVLISIIIALQISLFARIKASYR